MAETKGRTRHKLCPPPKLLRDVGFDELDQEYQKERDMTWSELFFDLVFVVAIAKLGEQLRETAMDWSTYLIIFLQFFAVWEAAAAYSNRFGTNDLPNMIFFSKVMCAVCFMTLHLKVGESGPDYHKFIMGAAVAWTLFVVVYVRVAMCSTSPRAVATGRFYIISNIIPMLLYGSVAVIPNPSKSLMWWIQIAAVSYIYVFGVARIGMVFVATTTGLFATECWKNCVGLFAPFHPEHFTERIGLVVIIFLGEIVDCICSVVSPTPAFYLKVLMCFWLVTALKNLYFDVDVRDVELHAIRRSAWSFCSWSYANVGVCCGAAIVGSGLHLICNHAVNEAVEEEVESLVEGEEEMEMQRQRILCNGLSLTLFSLTITSLSHSREWHKVTSTDGLSYKLKVDRLIFWCQVAAMLVATLVVWWLPQQCATDTILLGEVLALVVFLVVLNFLDEAVDTYFEEQGEPQDSSFTPIADGIQFGNSPRS